MAVKTTKAACSDKEQSSFMREMRVMSLMMHPNIVRLHGLVQHGESETGFFPHSQLHIGRCYGSESCVILLLLRCPFR